MKEEEGGGRMEKEGVRRKDGEGRTKEGGWRREEGGRRGRRKEGREEREGGGRDRGKGGGVIVLPVHDSSHRQQDLRFSETDRSEVRRSPVGYVHESDALSQRPRN